MLWLVCFSFLTCWHKMTGRPEYLFERVRYLPIMDDELSWTGNSALVLRYDNLFRQKFRLCSWKIYCKAGHRYPHWSLIRNHGWIINWSSVRSLVWCQSEIEKRYARTWMLLAWQWMLQDSVDSAGSKLYFPVCFWYRQGVGLIYLVKHKIAWCDSSITID